MTNAQLPSFLDSAQLWLAPLRRPLARRRRAGSQVDGGTGSRCSVCLCRKSVSRDRIS